MIYVPSIYLWWLDIVYKNPKFEHKMYIIYIYHDSWQAQLNNVQLLRFKPILLWMPYIQPLEEVRHLTLIGSSNYFAVLGSWNLLLIGQQVPYIWEFQQQGHWKCLQQLKQLPLRTLNWYGGHFTNINAYEV